MLSRICRRQKHLDGLRSCRESIGQTKSFSMDREVVKNLLTRPPETLMDRDCNNFYWEKKKEGLDRNESVEDLLSLKKRSFLRRKNTKIWMQQASNSNIDPINILSSPNISQHICKAFKIQNTHTHTLNKSNRFYISKTS